MEEKKLYNAVRKTITLADGREIMIETGIHFSTLFCCT